MLILELGAFSIMITMIMAAYGYNLTLPGYSRKKMLEGLSAQRQMYLRKMTGTSLMQISLIIMVSAAAMIFLIFGMFLEVKTVAITPKEVRIVLAQNRTIIIADGHIYEFKGYHHHIRRVYIKQKFNSYGTRCSDDKLIIEYKDQWEISRR